MKGRVVKLSSVVLAGAIVNVTVAWGFSLWGTLPQRLFVPYDDRQRQVSQLSEPMQSWQGRTIGLSITESSNAPWKHRGVSPDPPHFTEIELRAGFPSRSVSMSGFLYFDWGNVLLRERWLGRIGTPYSEKSDWMGMPNRVLPVIPIWPGFAINTVSYAAVLGLLFVSAGFVRRRSRINRGLCPACAYPVGLSDVCTECGKAVNTATIKS